MFAEITGKRIAICGAHGVGKTTLAKRIAEKTGRRYLPEVARELLDWSGYDWRSGNLVVEFQAAIAAVHIFLVKANLETAWVSDRTILDIMAYTSLADPFECPPDWVGGVFPQAPRESLDDLRTLYGAIRKLVEDGMARGAYDSILFRLTCDSGRVTEEQTAVEGRILKLLTACGVPFICLREGDTLLIDGHEIPVWEEKEDTNCPTCGG